jgi:hypothetical protein
MKHLRRNEHGNSVTITEAGSLTVRSGLHV